MPDNEGDGPRVIVGTTVIGPKATSSLLERLRPLVYVNGACSCCSHSDKENAAIGEVVLAWWTEYNLDNMDKETTE